MGRPSATARSVAAPLSSSSCCNSGRLVWGPPASPLSWPRGGKPRLRTHRSQAAGGRSTAGTPGRPLGRAAAALPPAARQLLQLSLQLCSADLWQGIASSAAHRLMSACAVTALGLPLSHFGRLPLGSGWPVRFRQCCLATCRETTRCGHHQGVYDLQGLAATPWIEGQNLARMCTWRLDRGDGAFQARPPASDFLSDFQA